MTPRCNTHDSAEYEFKQTDGKNDRFDVILYYYVYLFNNEIHSVETVIAVAVRGGHEFRHVNKYANCTMKIKSNLSYTIANNSFMIVYDNNNYCKKR